jgi:hypothetical protein
MEQKIFSKLSVYDQFGYLMVGAIALFVLTFNAVYFYKLDIPPFNLNNFLVWFIVAYFCGHLIQGVANFIGVVPLFRRLVKEPKDDFSKKEEEILNQVSDFFGLDKTDSKRAFGVCMTFTTAKDITGQVQIFNATYSLYRGWLTIFFLQSLFLLYQYLLSYSAIILLQFAISIFLTLIFYRRARRFWRYIRDKIFETFIVAKTLKL